MSSEVSRRTALTTLAAASASRPAQADTSLSDVVRVNDEAVERYLERQVTDPESRWRGAVPDAFGLHQPGSAGGVLERLSASFLHTGSRFYQSEELARRMKLAIGHLNRVQTPDGNVDLLITNFNSPPDAAFVILNAATAGYLLRKHRQRELFAELEPFLRKAGGGIAKGGVHTPNHRWVCCAALAQIYDLFPHPSLLRRVHQWLAEGIDIDADGQYSERSTTVYNAITDRALVIVAHKLGRPELLDPVRKNLNTMLYLLHPGYEVVTEISHRQDRNTRGTMSRYWFPLRYLTHRDANGQYAKVLQQIEPRHARLSALMEYPELNQPGPRASAVPDDYEKHFPATGLVRVRRGKTSAALLLRGHSRFLALRRGEAVINGVRFAAAFFGKGQFVPNQVAKRGGRYHLSQSMDAGYYQPFDPPRKVPWGVEGWYGIRPQRRRTEISRMDYEAVVRELKNGFEVRILAQGTDDVPLAVEINLREGGGLEGCVAAPGVEDACLLPSGGYATYQMGSDVIRFGPGLRLTDYTQVRGAYRKLPGPSVYLTGYTPFDHTLTFEWS